MRSSCAIALFVFLTAQALAQGNPLPPVGAVFEGTFTLGGRTLPLPEGKFVVAAASLGEPALLEGDLSKQRPQLARALLVQTEPPRVRATVWASVALKPASFRFNWVTYPCRREDTLFRADLSGSLASDGENCLLVDHWVGYLGPKSEGLWKEASEILAEQNVRVPVPVVIVAHVTRMEGWQLVRASYAFNPQSFGCSVGRNPSWAASPWHRKRIGEDAAKARFVEGVTAWGKVAQQEIDQIVSGKSPAARASSANPIHGCP